MMATTREPSRVRKAMPYGPALDRSLAVAKTALLFNKAKGLKSLAHKGTFLSPHDSSARKDLVFGAARVYTVAVPGPKWKSWTEPPQDASQDV